MTKRVNVLLIAVFAIFLTATGAIELRPTSRYQWQLFELGIKHGVEDKQSGIKYGATDAGWKIIRNGDWTSSEKIVAQRLFAEPPASAKNDTSIFMAGYSGGSNAALCLALVTIFVAGTLILIFRAGGRKRMLANQRQ